MQDKQKQVKQEIRMFTFPEYKAMADAFERMAMKVYLRTIRPSDLRDLKTALSSSVITSQIRREAHRRWKRLEPLIDDDQVCRCRPFLDDMRMFGSMSETQERIRGAARRLRSVIAWVINRADELDSMVRKKDAREPSSDVQQQDRTFTTVSAVTTLL